MIFDNDGRYPPLSSFLAQQLAFLEAGTDPSLIGIAIAEKTGESNEQRVRVGTSVAPTFAMFKGGGVGVVLWAGTENLSQAGFLVSDWSTRIPNDTFPGLPANMDNVAFQAIQQYQAFGPLEPQRVFWVGHSYGGALAQAAAAKYKSLRPSIATLSVSYGAPRVGDHRFAVLQRQNSNTRWMNDDDGIPLLPPSIPPAILFAAGLGAEVIGRWEQFEHGGGGVVLDSAGNATAGELPPRGVLQTGANLVSTIFKMMTDPHSAHSMSTYYDRLNLLASRTNPPAHNPTPTAAVEPDRRTHTHTQNQQMETFVDTIVHTGLTQQNGPIVIPDDRHFKKVKFEGLWWVLFGDQLILVAPTRRRAGRFCVIGNDFLRRLHRMAGVDTESLKVLFGEYLAAAVVPDNGFVPTIKQFPSS